MLEITGKTYIHRHFLRAQGCVWNKARNAWMAPDAATAARCQAQVNADQPPRARTVHARVDAANRARPSYPQGAARQPGPGSFCPDHAHALALAHAVQNAGPAEIASHARDLALYVMKHHNLIVEAEENGRYGRHPPAGPSNVVSVPLPWEGGPAADDPSWDDDAERAAYYESLDRAEDERQARLAGV